MNSDTKHRNCMFLLNCQCESIVSAKNYLFLENLLTQSSCMENTHKMNLFSAATLHFRIQPDLEYQFKSLDSVFSKPKECRYDSFALSLRYILFFNNIVHDCHPRNTSDGSRLGS